jgi:hypothetical protein
MSPPNPLLLLIEIRKSGAIKLNSQNAGQLSNLTPLSSQMASVLEQRKRLGIYSEATNEVETAN